VHGLDFGRRTPLPHPPVAEGLVDVFVLLARRVLADVQRPFGLRRLRHPTNDPKESQGHGQGSAQRFQREKAATGKPAKVRSPSEMTTRPSGSSFTKSPWAVMRPTTKMVLNILHSWYLGGGTRLRPGSRTNLDTIG
jgi:hypothetical protein